MNQSSAADETNSESEGKTRFKLSACGREESLHSEKNRGTVEPQLTKHCSHQQNNLHEQQRCVCVYVCVCVCVWSLSHFLISEHRGNESDKMTDLFDLCMCESVCVFVYVCCGDFSSFMRTERKSPFSK